MKINKLWTMLLAIGLPNGVVSRLLRVGVLVDPDAEAPRRGRWALKRAFWSRQFRTTGYVSTAGLLHPFHIGSIQRYYRRLLRTCGLKLGDSGSPLRYIAHNEPVTAFFPANLPGSSAIWRACRSSLPTCTWPLTRGGAELPVHTDRIPCKYSISLLIDYSPERSGASPWPRFTSTLPTARLRCIRISVTRSFTVAVKFLTTARGWPRWQRPRPFSSTMSTRTLRGLWIEWRRASL